MRGKEKSQDDLFSIALYERTIEGKRVVVLSIPPRPTGTPLEFKGKYLQRVGGSLGR